MIDDGKKVKIHYTLTVEGEIVDSTQGSEPMEFVFGDSAMLPSFQEAIKGLKAGDKNNFSLQPENGFGQPDPNAIVQIPRSNLPEGDLQPGMMFSATSEQGYPMRATVVKIEDDTATMDFNHPLAGKELLFDVEIIAVT